MDPKGKVAVITGAARIGQTVASVLAQRGCSLAIIYRGSLAPAEATVAAAKAAGVKAVAIKADARNADQIEAAVVETVRALGSLDILINMASTYIKTPNPTEGTGSMRSIPTPGARSCSPLTPRAS